MTIKASDLPEDGSSKLVLVNGTLFEVQRHHVDVEVRRSRSIYKARVVPESGYHPAPGWWYRSNWKLMLADLKLMAR